MALLRDIPQVFPTALTQVKRERRMPRSILIVDDNVDAARSLEALLRLEGHEVEMQHDGVSGLAAARRMRPDFIFLDISMPGMNGYDLARALRLDQTFSRTRIIAMSGFGNDEDRTLSIEAGCDLHLVKPYDPQFIESLLGG